MTLLNYFDLNNKDLWIGISTAIVGGLLLGLGGL